MTEPYFAIRLLGPSRYCFELVAPDGFVRMTSEQSYTRRADAVRAGQRLVAALGLPAAMEIYDPYRKEVAGG